MVATKSLMSTLLRMESCLSGAEPVRTAKIPKTPKTTDAYVNTLVAIFCIILVYQA